MRCKQTAVTSDETADLLRDLRALVDDLASSRHVDDLPPTQNRVVRQRSDRGSPRIRRNMHTSADAHA